MVTSLKAGVIEDCLKSAGDKLSKEIWQEKNSIPVGNFMTGACS